MKRAIMFLGLTAAFTCAISVTRAQAPAPQAGRIVQGRVVVDGGATAPRLTLPIQSPGRAALSVAINPRADGAFTITLPEGRSAVGAAAGLPAGATLRSLTYGAVDLSKEILTVTATDTAELVITVALPRPVSISGRVTGLRSTEGTLVFLAGTTLDVSLNPDGTFLFPRVPPGSYRARLINSGASVDVPVTAGASDVTGLVIPVPKERVVTGLVMVEGGGRNSPLAVDAKSAAGTTISSTTPQAYQGTNTGQFFLLKLEDGEYAMSVRNVPAGYRVKSMTYGATDLLKQPLKIDGLAVWTVTIRLAP